MDDELKFSQNTLTYQEIALKAAELPGPAAAYVFETDPAARDFAKEFFASQDLDAARTVGLNTGAGPVFAHKAWLPERFAALADWLAEEKGPQGPAFGRTGRARGEPTDRRALPGASGGQRRRA